MRAWDATERGRGHAWHVQNSQFDHIPLLPFIQPPSDVALVAPDFADYNELSGWNLQAV